jgi:hypothetical protein
MIYPYRAVKMLNEKVGLMVASKNKKSLNNAR